MTVAQPRRAIGGRYQNSDFLFRVSGSGGVFLVRVPVLIRQQHVRTAIPALGDACQADLSDAVPAGRRRKLPAKVGDAASAV